MRSKLLLAAGVSVLSLAFAMPAGAAVAFTTSESTFNTAVAASGVGLYTNTFAGRGIPVNSFGSTASPLSRASEASVLPGITFTTPNNSVRFLYVGPTFNTFWNPSAVNTNTVLSTSSYKVPISVGFDVPQRTVSLAVLSLRGAPILVEAFAPDLSSLGGFTLDAAIAGSGSFIGLTTSAGTTIGSVTLSQPSIIGTTAQDSVNIDRVAFLPEPAGLTAITATLIGAGLRRRRR